MKQLGHEPANLPYLGLLIYNVCVESEIPRKYQWCYYGARELLIKMAVNSVHRDTDHDTYEDYFMRYTKMLPLELLVIPGSTVNDFEFRTGESEFPVVSAAMVSATRSNQNATARAGIRSNGFEVSLIHAVIADRVDEDPDSH